MQTLGRRYESRFTIQSPRSSGSVSQSPIEICVTVLGGAWCYLLCAYRGVEYLEDAIVPMCQSPKIADVFLKAGQAPANDNCTSVNAPRNSPSIYNAFPATLLTVSVFACFTAFFFF